MLYFSTSRPPSPIPSIPGLRERLSEEIDDDPGNRDSDPVMRPQWLGTVVRTTSLAVAVLIATACSPGSMPTPSASPWAGSVPTPAPDQVVAQPVVARSANSITLLPISPKGAAIDVSYAYDMPHCGLGSPIDVDGSFWDAAVLPLDPVQFDGRPGGFRLTSPTEAVFRALDGSELRLVRHTGAKEFLLCY